MLLFALGPGKAQVWRLIGSEYFLLFFPWSGYIWFSVLCSMFDFFLAMFSLLRLFCILLRG